MAVQLILMDILIQQRDTGGVSVIDQTHPCYAPFMNHVWGSCVNMDQYIALTQKHRSAHINKYLTPYKGRVIEHSFLKLVLEFESECDLTRFVLAWS
jgi:hypothetical protein